jgi:hypothetical protein
MGWIAGIGFGIAISGFFLCERLAETGTCVFSWLLERPLIYVVIPVFQMADTLGRAVESCLVQSFEDFEVLVVVDAAGGYGSAIVQNLSCRFPMVRLLRREDGTGCT